MKQFNQEVDAITHEVSSLLNKILVELKDYRLDAEKESAKGVCYITFHLGREYFLTARDSLLNGHVVGGGGVLRTCIENVADLFYIFKSPDRTDKYAKQYVQSVEVFRKNMMALSNESSSEAFAERKVRQVNKWTNASYEDRISDLSDALINIYDLFSYFSHPNPGSIGYLGIPGLRNGQINLAKQGNCVIALTLMAVCINHTDLVSVNHDEVDAISKKLGLPLTAK